MNQLRYQDPWITASSFILALLGFVMVGSASVGSAALHGSNWVFMNMFKHALYCAMGIFVMYFCAYVIKVRFVSMKKWPMIFVGGIMAMLVCLLFPGANGSRAWIPFPLGSIQPSEFMKIILILILSLLLSNNIKAFQYHGSFRSQADKENYYKKKFYYCLGVPLFILIISCVCVVIQGDIGTALIMAAVGAGVFYGASDPYYAKYQKMFLVGGLALCAILIPLLITGFRAARITTWLNPLSDPYNSSFQVLNGLIAFSNKGRLFGSGLGNSTQKYGYITYAYNDFIACIIFEELGILGLALMLIPSCIIIFRLLSYSKKVQDSRDKMVLVGIATYFFAHLFVNIGGVCGAIPMTGVPLLLVTLGGSSTIAAFTALGFAQSVIIKHNKAKHHILEK